MLILALIFLPYMPGEYDASAVTLSGIAQLVGFSSLLLVPPGIAWLIHEIIKQRKKGPQTSNRTYHFAIAALIVSAFVALITALGAFINHNPGNRYFTYLHSNCFKNYFQIEANKNWT